MNEAKRALTVLLGMICALGLLAGCGGDPPAGKYCIYTIDGEPADEAVAASIKASGITTEEYLKITGLKSINESMTIELRSDGSAVETSGAMVTAEGTWRQDGDKIIFTTAGGDMELLLNDGKLTIHMGPTEMVFKKQ